jgi:UDP-2,3-diacylglucosamine pyrophosphatase LpxH
LAANPGLEGRIDTLEGTVATMPAAQSTAPDPNSPMVASERTAWYDRYHGTPNDLGADVFQHARLDLEDWIASLIRYQRSAAGTRMPIHFIQTGDMFDLWIGLHRYFTNDPTGHVLPETRATSFVNYWIEQTIDHTEQGRVAQALITAQGTLNATFLYGNHDNYLATLPSGHHPSGVTVREAAFSDRDFAGKLGALWVEHGHRWDGSNADGAINGHAGTQLAFFFPPVRNYEDRVRKAIAHVGGDPPERIAYFGEAADLCIGNRCSIVVMGHTHHGMVKRVDIVGPP